MNKTQNLMFFFLFGNQKIADEKKDDFIDTHPYISECLTNLVFFSHSPQVRYLVTGSESGSESESEYETPNLPSLTSWQWGLGGGIRK